MAGFDVPLKTARTESTMAYQQMRSFPVVVLIGFLALSITVVGIFVAIFWLVAGGFLMVLFGR